MKLIIGRFSLAVVCCLGLIIVSSRLAGSVQGNSAGEYESDQLVVKVRSGTSIASINDAYGTTTLRALLNGAGIYLLQVAAEADAYQIAQLMAGDERLLYAELNFIGEAPEANPSDIYAWPDGEAITIETTEQLRAAYGWEWSAADSARYYHQPASQALNLLQAQAYSRGDGVMVAILDTGFDLNHPALAASFVSYGYDFVDDDPYPMDVGNGLDDDDDGLVDEALGHGTHVAGIVHLVAPDAQIMPLRVLDADGQGNTFVIAEAMLYAAQNGADVVSMSLGTRIPSVFLQDVVDQVTAEGVLVVAAAGNSNSEQRQYPAAASCVVAVTALNQGRVRSAYANFGDWIDVSAPGQRIFSTVPGGDFARWGGTSMATPFVAGQLALIRTLDPSLSMEEVGRLIALTAQSVDEANPAYAGLLGSGRIDIGASLEYLVGQPIPADAPELLSGCGGE